MTDLSVREEMTVAQLRAVVARLRRQLAEVAGAAAGLEAWCVQLPTAHVPSGEPVLVNDLVPTTVPDPDALSRGLREMADLGERLAAAVAGTRHNVAEQCGLFAPEQGWAAQDAEAARVRVTAQCGAAWGDDARFDRQTRALRGVLGFDGRRRVWEGLLSPRVEDSPAAWRALAEAAEAGASVRVRP